MSAGALPKLKRVPTVDEEIQRSIDEIEQSENVTVLYACESGSRAWGFHSQDSDYDVRFIYAHPPDWYLSVDLEKKRDVIERPILDDLDVSGWDLRKSLQLFRKSNPPLLEWLDSPIVYRDRFDVAFFSRAGYRLDCTRCFHQEELLVV